MICDDCKKDKEDVHETTCPFTAEIEGKEEEATLCDDCYGLRCDEI